MPNLYIIAGPNGAGKTTSAKVLVPEFFHSNYFINADEIARAINPISPEKAAIPAGRLMLTQITELIENKKNFVFETTLSAKTYVGLIQNAKKFGYKINLVFLYLSSAKLAQTRVNKRVKAGGHKIEKDVVNRRYERGITNLIQLYMPIVDNWFIYDNSDKAQLVAYKEKNKTEIMLEDIWQKIHQV